MNIWKAWNRISLVVRIIVGLAVGVVLGLAVPSFSIIGILGDLFVGALKALAPLLVFFIVMHSLASQREGGQRQHENGHPAVPAEHLHGGSVRGGGQLCLPLCADPGRRR